MNRVFLIVTLAAVCSSLRTESLRYQVGDTVQDETFTTMDGQTLTLSQFKGKTLLLAFFTDG